MYQWLIIDGNNLIHMHPKFKRMRHTDFDGARKGLVAEIDGMATTLASRVTVVFDGTIGGKAQGYGATQIDVEFSTADITADGVIERLVYGSKRPQEITVVTSDRVERDTVEAAGGNSVSCKSFLEDLNQGASDISQEIQKIKDRPPPGRLGDFFPDM